MRYWYTSQTLTLVVLASQHARLSRHLVVLEQNLPWRAVTEDFASGRPLFVQQLRAVKGPLDAQLVLTSLTGVCVLKLLLHLEALSYYCI